MLNGARLANHINNYFISLPTILVADLPNIIDFNYFNYLPRTLSSFYFLPTNFNEVYDLIMNLKNKGSSLSDVKPDLLKLVINKVSPFIVKCYNLCIQNGSYPDDLKNARVIPVFKSSSKDKVQNYRPISNLSVFNKIFEKLTYSRISCFFENHNIISNFQFGFRENSNTTIAIFHFISDLLITFHKKLYTIALFLDLRRAFDTINKELLLFKLSCYGVRGSSLSFIKSYLTGRSQYVEINGCISDTSGVNIGVPQGSVLGPLLFNLFINDIINAFPCKKIFYADDGVLYVTAGSMDDCVELIKEVIRNLSTWLLKNKLIPNTEKTKLMLFTPRHVDLYPNIDFNGTILEWVDSFKYLGVILDSNLNFVQHSTFVKQKLSKINGTMYAISNMLPQKTLLQIYNCLVYSAISQNIIIWCGCR